MLETAYAVERFGAWAVYGRQLTANEMRQMALAADLAAAYKSRAASESFAAWASKNPAAARLLGEAEALTYDG